MLVILSNMSLLTHTPTETNDRTVSSVHFYFPKKHFTLTFTLSLIQYTQYLPNGSKIHGFDFL